MHAKAAILGAVERLDLRLFVDAQEKRPVGRLI
jgi:hypothetical protein